MTLQELVDVWSELKDINELGFCDLANAVEKIVGITNSGGVKVRDLNSPLPSEVFIEGVLAALEENQQPNP